MEPDQVTDLSEASGAPMRAGAPWRPEERKLLGTMPDSEVARALNRSEKAVWRRRQRLRILAYQSPFHRWTPEEEQLLGTLPDAEVAARTGHPLSGVIQRRHRLHVRLPRPGHQPWTTAEDQLLGTMKDRDLAQRLGRPLEAVAERRRRLAIPHYYPDYRRLWTPAEEQLLGTMTDARLARRLKRSVETVRTRRAHKGIPVFNPKKHWWTAERRQVAGTAPGCAGGDAAGDRCERRKASPQPTSHLAARAAEESHTSKALVGGANCDVRQGIRCAGGPPTGSVRYQR